MNNASHHSAYHTQDYLKGQGLYVQLKVQINALLGHIHFPVNHGPSLASQQTLKEGYRSLR